MITLPLHELGKRCETVGLRRAEPTHDMPLPDGAAMWTSSYATLLLWPVASVETHVLEEAEITGQDWLDENLALKEGGSLTDGYLVLALPSPPSEIGVIREIEQSTMVCRKHVIWFEELNDLSWKGVEKITVIALPQPIIASEDLSYPDMDEDALGVWEIVRKNGPNEASTILELLR
ncbi:hypothetical protein FSZ31_06400 [Sphingorhabdus soli]|uniref:Uncharacterized protein n=1 Tax=Flavisphingopyxis soli TaxID=2601267 RepID=A0A5C6UMC9_9SPHN|nr:ABC-three component system middle component 1 [Sphingorhabdus soli]TXC74323.1 hypothetical protein FSZ31_06400 [Sphingorhabdus soli]